MPLIFHLFFMSDAPDSDSGRIVFHESVSIATAAPLCYNHINIRKGSGEMKYNDEFDDIFDEDEELEDIPGIDELLEAHDMNIETAAKRCDEYMSEFDGFIKRIGSASDKFGICEKLAVMLERHETDSADLPWCYAVLSSFADFLFREEDDDEVRISSYLKLTDEVEFRMRCCKEQASAVKEFNSIISGITRSEETV